MPQSEGGSIFQCGREISRQQLDEILETVGLFPSLSRKELSATICEHLGWVTVTGSNKLDACMKLLEKLECKGLIRLPAKQEQYRRNQFPKPIPLTNRTASRADVTGNLQGQPKRLKRHLRKETRLSIQTLLYSTLRSAGMGTRILNGMVSSERPS